jgi:hypothetical protein
LKSKIPFLSDYIQKKRTISIQEIIEIDDSDTLDETTTHMKLEEEKPTEGEIQMKKEQFLSVKEDEIIDISD